MFSFLKKVVTALIPWGSDFPGADASEDEQEILRKINCMNFEEKETPEIATNLYQPFGQSDPVQFDVETFQYVHKTGKVTHLCSEYGLIDNVIYFEPSQISLNLTLKPNDEVWYSAYRVRKNEAERVYKVYALKNNGLESGLASDSNGIQKTGEITALQRVITGRVTRRRGREIYVEHADIWCNLDKVEALFIPVEGDWVELQAVVTVDVDVVNLIGDILEVQSIRPLLMKSGFGRVTLWSESNGEGAIENMIYFTSVSCEGGYIPKLGDKIVYDAVESDQGRFSWRALKVLCCLKPEVKSKMDKERNNCVAAMLSHMVSERNGISVKPPTCSVEVELNQVKSVTVEVTNDGKERQLLVGANFLNAKNCQTKLLHPQKYEFYIKPKETVVFSFECEGKSLGMSREMFYFHFKDFVIAKRFEITVKGTKEMNRLLNCNVEPGIAINSWQEKPCVMDEGEPDVVLYGPRPWMQPKFSSKERRCGYKIPKELWEVGRAGPRKSESLLLRYAPYLREEMNFATYAERFHTLLYMEEISLRLSSQEFDMKEVCLEQRDDYFVLEVPGLVEKRPSVIVGDKIVLSQPWFEEEKTKHIGYVHEVREKEVHLKFHSSFHDMYNGNKCNISFEPNTNSFSKCHEAVNRANRVLGEQWLFPSAVNEKPPLIAFDILEQGKPLAENVVSFFQKIPNEQKHEGPVKSTKKKKQKKHNESVKSSNQKMQIRDLPPLWDVTQIESNMRDSRDNPVRDRVKKTLTWANKNLNERQKLAVESVLKGQGRPLPYIIIGPPGTGKTITLVEIIIQVYRLMPESRILIATSSNSSADLICERLIDIANIKPGQMVRLVALYRVQEGLVPVKLIPYSTYFNGYDSPRKNHSKKDLKTGVRGSSRSELVGRHRITVATCTAIGVLHQQRLPPGHFTHILVDEAGQTSEPEVLISATFQNVSNGQLVLTGDPQQLGPVINSKLAKRFGLNVSLMERLTSRFPYAKDLNSFPQTAGFDPRFITQLNLNYRSVPEILSLPNKMFYNSDLIPMVSQTDSEEAKVIEKLNFKGEGRATPAAIVFHGVIGQNCKDKDSPSWFNPHEVWHVIFYVRQLYSAGLTSNDIGVVTPYTKQVQKVRNHMMALHMSVPKIGSVEEFQGQERCVIIVSTVRSSAKHVNSDISHSIGFVASPQRLNVALTRARALLIIIGNPILLSKDPYWVNVVKYCLKNKSYTGCNIDVLSETLDKGGEKGGRD